MRSASWRSANDAFQRPISCWHRLLRAGQALLRRSAEDLVMPPAEEFVETVRLPRETVFVIDTSGSMGGASIVQAREALLLALDQLRPEDFFNIIEFDSSFTALYSESRPAMPAALVRLIPAPVNTTR